MTNERKNKIKKIFYSVNPIVKTSFLKSQKIHSRDISELINDGYIKKIKTGYYIWTTIFEQLIDFEIVHMIIPDGVISLYSSAVFHELTTVNPTNISLTIPSDMIKPTLPSYPPVELFYCSKKYINLGVIDCKLEHMSVKIYDPERTVCDFFKYYDKTGNDVALEVLKNYMNSNKKNFQKLLEYATILKVKKYIKPYVEALL